MSTVAELEVETTPDSATPLWRPASGTVCPFCGSVNPPRTARCPHCTLEDTPANRAATRMQTGPWYLLQSKDLAAPGMSLDTLIAGIHRGTVTPDSIVRGPATQQLWRYAGKVKGLSREMGFCYVCGESLGTTAELCPHCNRSQTPPQDASADIDVAPLTIAPASPAAVPSAAAVAPLKLVAPPRPVAASAAVAPISPAPATPAPTAVPMKLLAAPMPAAARVSPSSAPIAAGSKPEPLSQRSVAGQKYVPPAPEPQDVTPEIAPARPPRRLPREDLLTPTEVAKAFSIDFNFDPSAASAPLPVKHWTLTIPTLPKLPAMPRHAMHVTAALLMTVGLTAAVRTVLIPRLAVAPTGVLAWADARLHAAAAPHAAEPTTPAPLDIAVTPARFAEPAPVAPVNAQVPAAAIAKTMPPAALTLAIAEPTPTTSPADDVQRLWTAALDAESRGNFVQAVRIYERIQSLPSDTWPASLNTRVQLARQELVAGTY